MQRVMLLLACALVSACDYRVPLVTEPALDIDRSIIGLWQEDKEGEVNQLLILPLDERAYLVSYPSGGHDAMYARAALCRVADLTLAQLEWLGTDRGDTADDDVVYQYAAYTLEGDTLHVRLLNPFAVDNDIESSNELVKAIEEKADDPDLFRNIMVFQRVNP